MDLNNVGNRLLTLRRGKNLTQAELAKKLGVTHQTVSKWENGLHLPDTEMLLQLSRLYDVTLEYILTEENTSVNQSEGTQEHEFTKINGLVVNIVTALLLIPVSWLIITVKFRWMNEPFSWSEFFEKFSIWLLTFLTTFIMGILIHELIKYFIYKKIGVKGVSVRFLKDGFIFLYSPDVISIKQARVLWIMPYLLLVLTMLISIFIFNIFFCMAVAFLLVAASDDLIMYLHLRQENPNSMFIQAKNFLGYRCIEKSDLNNE